MIKKIILAIIIAVSVPLAKIGVIVNKNLITKPLVREAINTYVNDLIVFGDKVWIDTTSFDEDNTIYSARRLRDSLRVHYLYDSLKGAVLVGQLPYVIFEECSNLNADYGPLEYYFMDLNDELDTAWKDLYVRDSLSGIGYFDTYTGDGVLEIWISRVIAHNLYYFFDDTIKFKEDSVIAAYFERVHNWVYGITEVPKRALAIKDITFLMSEFELFGNLNVAKNILNFPHDQPAIIQRELNKGYLWFTVMEHSSEVAHDCAREHLDKNGKFLSAHFRSGLHPKNRTFVQSLLSNNPPKTLFIHNLGCSGLDFSKDNCLGVMYAMLGEGILCLGSTTDYHPKRYDTFMNELSSYKTIGEAYIAHINNEEIFGGVSGSGLLGLIGVGTLKITPQIPNLKHSLIIDSIVVTKVNKNKYHLFNDSIILKAYIRSDNNVPLDPNNLKLTWYGLNDSITGNNVLYVMDGQKASTSGYPASPQIILHAEYPGYLSASKVYYFPMIYYDGHISLLKKDAKFYTTSFSKQEDGWNIDLIGISMDINYDNTNDDYLYYSILPEEDGNCFIIKARVKNIRSHTNKSKAGVMTRYFNLSSVCPFAALSVNKNNQLFFEYRKDFIDSTVTRVYNNYPMDSYLMLKRVRENVYAYISLDGTNYTFIDSVTFPISILPEYVGIFSCANDTIEESINDSIIPRATFSNVEILHIDTVLPLLLPELYARDTLIIGDRNVIKANNMGVGKYLQINLDSHIDMWSDSSIIVTGNAVIKDRSIIENGISLNGKLTKSNSAIVKGSIKENLSNSFVPMETKSVSVGNVSKYIYGVDSLEYGTYKDIVVKSRGTLVLLGGEYNVRSFILEPDANVILEGGVILNVSTQLIFNDRYLIDRSNAGRGCIMDIYTNAPLVTICEERKIPGQFHIKNIMAPNSTVLIKSRASYSGRLKARKIIFEPDVELIN